MSLINVNADFHDLVEQVRRIADALDRAIPPVSERVTPKPAVFISVDSGAIAEAEAEADRKREVEAESVA